MNTKNKSISTPQLAEIMGILNVTPDSFSDGSVDLGYNLEKMDRLFSEGADWVDIGAEATNPQSTPIDVDTEWSRLEPLLNKVPDKYRDRISVDTRKEEIARRVIGCEVKFINSQAGLFSDSFYKDLANPWDLKYVCMHPGTPPLRVGYVVEGMMSFFHEAHEKLVGLGLDPSNIYMDYGIGFSKTDPMNLLLLSSTSVFAKDFNLLVGMSRKSFIGRILGIDSPKDRDPFTKGIEFGLLSSSKIIRTHDVKSLFAIRSTLIC